MMTISWTSKVRECVRAHTEQEQVIDTIRQDNEKANYWYRMSLLVIYGLILVLYVYMSYTVTSPLFPRTSSGSTPRAT